MPPAIIQVPLEVPPEIFDGLASGVYNLFGGVVRNLDGSIVKHLQDAPTDAAEHIAAVANEAATRIPAQLKKPWVIVASLVGTVVVTAVAAAVIRSRTKSRQQQAIPETAEAVDVPASIGAYKLALKIYLEAARAGTLDGAVISGFIDALKVVEEQSDANDFAIDFNAEESQALVSLVVGYTRTLTDANALRLEDFLPPVGDGGAFDALLRHLEAQRRIFVRGE